MRLTTITIALTGLIGFTAAYPQGPAAAPPAAPAAAPAAPIPAGPPAGPPAEVEDKPDPADLAARAKAEARAKERLARHRANAETEAKEAAIRAANHWATYREREEFEYKEKRRVDLERHESHKRTALAREAEKRTAWDQRIAGAGPGAEGLNKAKAEWEARVAAAKTGAEADWVTGRDREEREWVENRRVELEAAEKKKREAAEEARADAARWDRALVECTDFSKIPPLWCVAFKK